jgi:hypothetical protein
MHCRGKQNDLTLEGALRAMYPRQWHPQPNLTTNPEFISQPGKGVLWYVNLLLFIYLFP